MKRFLTAAVLGLALASPTLAQEGGQAAQRPAEATAPAEMRAVVEVPAPVPEEPAAPVWAGPEVTLQTSMGDIVVVLDTAGAPKTSAQFLKLVRNGHYNGSAFYRIEKDFVIQFGDLDAKLKYRPANVANVPLETANNKHSRGALSLARADEPGSRPSSSVWARIPGSMRRWTHRPTRRVMPCSATLSPAWRWWMRLPGLSSPRTAGHFRASCRRCPWW